MDAAVFSKADLTFSASGMLAVLSETGHGIVSKDDLKITGGKFTIFTGEGSAPVTHSDSGWGGGMPGGMGGGRPGRP